MEKEPIEDGDRVSEPWEYSWESCRDVTGDNKRARHYNGLKTSSDQRKNGYSEES